MLRPIVLGDVFVKLLAKLCIRGLRATWPTPKSSFGTVLADAAFLTPVAVREAVIMGAPVVAVRRTFPEHMTT